MSGIHCGLVPAFMHKRKRSETDDDVQAELKRRITSLPFRSTELQRSPFLTITPSSTVPIGHHTAVDTSEDETTSHEHDANEVWSNRPPSLTESVTSSESSESSIKVHVSDECEDQNMDLTFSSPPRPRTGRARSNDILSSPQRQLRTNLLTPDSALANRERIPTPINSHFDTRLEDLPSAPRHNFPPLRTYLSPMIEQDGFVPLHSLPSPATPTIHQVTDADAMMGFEQTSTGMSSLRVRDEDDVMDDVHILDEAAGDGHTNHSGGRWRQEGNGRSARLHMGYLPGCEKCTQKVPGHYSHILWS